jgi:hypothetical protein
MVLSIFNGSPLSVNNECGEDDIFTGDGTTQTFFLQNKTVAQLGSSIQAGNIIYYQENGGFTVNSGANSFTLSSAPGIGVQIVAPASTTASISAFDQPQVLGVVNPQSNNIPLYVGDITTINNYKYSPLPGYAGIQISCVNLITAGPNPQTSWITFASADASGNAMTFGATGQPLYLPSINAATTVSASAGSSATTLFITAASTNTFQFWPGQFVRINIGNSTQEVCQVIGVNYSNNSLTIAPGGTTYAHSAGETVYACAWKFWLGVFIPTNANSNTAVNAYNLGIQNLNGISARA